MVANQLQLAPRQAPDGSTLYKMPDRTYQLFREGQAAHWQHPAHVRRQTEENTVQLALAHFLRYLAEQQMPMAFAIQSAIVGEFWRSTYNSRFDGWKLDKRTHREAKESIRLEAATWKAAYQCLRAINAKGLWGFQYPSWNLGGALLQLITEAELIGWFARLDDGDRINAIKAKQQGINAALKRGENPFAPGTASHDFAATCLAEAESFPILEEHWIALLKARTALISHWLKSKPIALAESGKLVDRTVAAQIKKQDRRQNTRKNLK